MGLAFVRAPREAFGNWVTEPTTEAPVARAPAAVATVSETSRAPVPGVRFELGESPANQTRPFVVQREPGAATPIVPRGAVAVPAVRPVEAPSAGPAAGEWLQGGGPATGEPFASTELAPADKAVALRQLDEQHVRGCVKCDLCRTRRNTVFGEGDADARLMFVGEGPGFYEDESGRPFVGKAGQKLTEMIGAMKLAREQVYICNVVKCRAFLTGPPAKDRPPQPAEAAACMPYLHRQIEVVRPRAIVTLGLSATQHLLGLKQSMSRMRGNWHAWRGIPVMPTFHPSYVLRNYTPETRRAVWDDLKQVLAELGAGTAGNGSVGSGN